MAGVAENPPVALYGGPAGGAMPGITAALRADTLRQIEALAVIPTGRPLGVSMVDGQPRAFFGLHRLRRVALGSVSQHALIVGMPRRKQK